MSLNYAVKVSLNHGNFDEHPERTSKIRRDRPTWSEWSKFSHSIKRLEKVWNKQNNCSCFVSTKQWWTRKNEPGLHFKTDSEC